MTALLEARGLVRRFGPVTAVDDVSFALTRGERLAVIGPNGAGKSTCFALLAGQLKPDAGRVRLDGRDVTGLPPHRMWRAGVGRTFQVAAVFGSMTVAENVQTALASARGRLSALWPAARRLERAPALELLGRVGMAAQADRPASVLAYGDVKRLELAMALAHAPKLLVMDEPTAGMAPRERHALMELVGAIVAERRLGLVFTEHDMDVVFGHAERILVMAAGGIVAEGQPEQIRADPAVQRVYLGRGLGDAA